MNIWALSGGMVAGLGFVGMQALASDPRPLVESVDAQRYPVRSIASTEDGRTGGVGGGVSDAEADRIALENCEANARGGACHLEARRVRIGVVDKVAGDVRGPASVKLDFSRTSFDPQAVPFVWPDNRDRLSQFEKAPSKFKVLALSGSGSWAWRAGASIEEARANAVSACRSVNVRDESTVPCFIYAEGSTVVMKRADIEQR